MRRIRNAFLIAFTMTVIVTGFIASVPIRVFAQDPILAAPTIIDVSKTPGSTFSVDITIQEVAQMFGYDFRLYYNTTMLNATSASSLSPFTTQWYKNINDTGGYVDMSYSYPPGELFGLTWDLPPKPIATINFLVTDYGYSPLNLERTVLSDIYGGDIYHLVTDGRFVNIIKHDVAVTEVTVNRTFVRPGRLISINVTVKNEGTMDETFDVTVFYNSTSISTQTVSSLVPATTRLLIFTWDTTGVAFGTYQISAEAAQVAGETDTADNTLTSSQTVTITSQVIHDLAATNVTASPSIVFKGQNITVEATIKNEGTIEETFNPSAYFYNATAAYLIETKTSIFLWDGLSTTLTFSWNTSGVFWGMYTVKANVTVADDATPANNEKIDGQVGIALHDVAVKEVTTDTTIAAIGDVVNFAVKVENKGFQNATFSVTLYRNDTAIQTINYIDLNPASLNITEYSWNTTGVFPGDYTIKAVADTVYGELSIDDNTHFLDLIPPTVTIVGELHDIAIIDITVSSTIISGKEVAVNITVRNQGSVDETLNATLYYDSILIQRETDIFVEWQPFLNEELVSFTWNTTGVPLGVHTLSANLTILANEANTTNNAISTQVTISVHDVSVVSVEVNPTSTAVGGSVVITVVVKNNGNFTESFTVTVKYDGTVIRTISVEDLSTGNSRTLSFTWSTANIALGTYTLTATASTVTDETNTADNTKVGSQVTLTKISSTISITTNATTITLGGSVTISGSISPQRPGVLVTIWYKITGQQNWINLTAVKTNTNSQYSYAWTPTTVETYDIRTSWAGDSVTLADESDTRQLTVQEAPPPPTGIPWEYVAAGILIVAILIIIVYVLRMRKPGA